MQLYGAEGGVCNFVGTTCYFAMDANEGISSLDWPDEGEWNSFQPFLEFRVEADEVGS